MPWRPHDNNFNEDTQICVWNRNFFLNYGIKYADYEIAKYFSHEEILPGFNEIIPFCFHSFEGENRKYKKIFEEYKYN